MSGERLLFEHGLRFALRPSNPRRMSVTPAASHIFIPVRITISLKAAATPGRSDVDAALGSLSSLHFRGQRHLKTWFAFTPCARAISATLAPGTNVAPRSAAPPTKFATGETDARFPASSSSNMTTSSPSKPNSCKEKFRPLTFVLQQPFHRDTDPPRRKKPHPRKDGALDYAGDHLISHTLTRAVPSAQRGLTSVFGMGTGVTLAVNSPANF